MCTDQIYVTLFCLSLLYTKLTVKFVQFAETIQQHLQSLSWLRELNVPVNHYIKHLKSIISCKTFANNVHVIWKPKTGEQKIKKYAVKKMDE